MELPRLHETVLSLHWWFTVIVGSFFMSIFAAYAIKWFDRTASRASVRWRERQARAQQERTERIAIATKDSHAFLSMLALEQRLYTATVLATIGLAAFVALDQFHLVFALNRTARQLLFQDDDRPVRGEVVVALAGALQGDAGTRASRKRAEE